MTGDRTPGKAPSRAARTPVAGTVAAAVVALLIFAAYVKFSGCIGMLFGLLTADTLRVISLDALVAPAVPFVLVVKHTGVTLAAMLILLGATGAGVLLLRLCRLWPDGAWERGLFSAAAGLGVVAVLTLCLGLLGWLNRWCLAGILLLLAGAAYRDLWSLLRGGLKYLASRWRERRFATLLWIIIIPFFLMNLTRAFEPPWLYDVQEYHLGAPAQYHAADRITFLKGNVYAGFPQNVEMIYLLSTRLTGSPEAGAIAGKLVWATVGLLAALALRRLGERLFSPEAGAAAAVIFYLWPSVTVYAGIAYVEVGLAFYFVMSAWAFARYAHAVPESRLKPSQWLILAGVMAGLACGCKYPAVLFLIVPASVAIVAVWGHQPQVAP